MNIKELFYKPLDRAINGVVNRTGFVGELIF